MDIFKRLGLSVRPIINTAGPVTMHCGASIPQEVINAQEAWRIGLVNKVVPRDKLDEEVNKMARTISKLDNLVNECSKRCVNMVYELMNIRKANDWANEMEVLPAACPESAPMNAEFARLRDEQGLKAALDWRQSRFAEEDAWWMERLKARLIK